MTSVVRPHTVALLLALLGSSAGARAQTAWHEGFEGTQRSWSDAGGDGQYRIVQHQRLERDAHNGKGCEWLQIESNGGAHVYFAHDIGRPHVIDDLVLGLWVKSDRPGLQIAVRVVLPRTVDPQSKRPVTVTIAGTSYATVGRWQHLQLSGIPMLLGRQIRTLRLQLGPQVDGREAYVDAVLLAVSGGSGATNVWIDDLEATGYVASAGTAKEGVSLASGEAPLVPVRLPPVQTPERREEETIRLPSVGSPVPRRAVRLNQSLLSINDRPMFPRAIQHRGEPLDKLKKLGFNAVWLQRLPAPELLEEAERLGLWLICPPPRPLAPSGDIGPAFDSVLAWDLGSDLTEGDLQRTQQWSKEVKAADRRGHRPVICCPRIDLRGFSRSAADLLLVDRRPLGTSLEMRDYLAWIGRQRLLATPGTPIWTTVQTQPNEALRQQLMALEPRSAPPLCVSSEQIRLLVYNAVAAGSRGLLFLSNAPLDSPDAETQQRAMTLELLNLELEIMEPWAAEGSVFATVESPAVREVVGTLLHVKHAELLLPIWSAPMSQYVAPQSAANALSPVTPGVPEAWDAYELTPRGAQRLRPQRVTGGTQVVLPEFGLTAQVVFANDSSIVGAINRRAVENGRRWAELHRALAVRKLKTVEALAGQLAARTPVKEAAGWLDAAKKHLQTCDGQLSARDVTGGALSAQRAMRSLRLVERGCWDAAVKGQGLATPVTSPGAVSFETLPWHWRLVDRIDPRAGCRFGPSRIAGGDFEDLDTMVRAGWQYLQHPTEGVQTAVDLAPDAAHSGRFGLRLAAVAVDPKKSPAAVETPPILFTSPPVQVEAGQIVCIYGWVQVPGAITASSDGLLVVDSISGEALADRIGPTDGWRQFSLYRVATQSGPMCVSFALSGLGEARIDDVFIRVAEGLTTVTQR